MRVHACRRVSNAHVRRDLPYEDKTDEYGAPVWKVCLYEHDAEMQAPVAAATSEDIAFGSRMRDT